MLRIFINSVEEGNKMAKQAIFLLILALFLLISSASAEKACGVYFTKIGCPVCAKTDPIVLGQWVPSRNDVVIIEYVFNSWYEPNAILMGEYNLTYGTGGAVPLMIKNAEEKWTGIPAFYTNEHILQYAEEFFEGDKGECLLKEGEVSFEQLNLNNLPEKPKIWSGNRLLKRTGEAEIESDFLKQLLFAEDVVGALAGSQYEMKEIKAEPAPYSGGSIPFAQAVDIGGSWVLKLRQAIELPENVEPLQNGGNGGSGGNQGNENSDYWLPISIAAIFIGLVAIIVFIKVKSK